MSKQTHHDQTITQYLLGSLPEAEAERLDELSITDDEFAEALRAAENDLVDAYVRDELTGAPLEQFKSYYLASPLRRGKVEFAQAFRGFTKRKTSRWGFVLSIFTTPRLALQWGAAFAALALLIAGAWLVSENTRLRRQVSQTQARRDALAGREQELQKELEGQRAAHATAGQELARVREERGRIEQELQKAREEQRAAGRLQPSPPGGVGIASFTLAPQTRGAGQIETVSVPAKTSYVAMRLELEPDDYPAYRVALLEQSTNRTLWRSDKLAATATGDVKALGVSFRAGLLKPRAVYVLRVMGASPSGASEIVGDYSFRVVK